MPNYDYELCKRYYAKACASVARYLKSLGYVDSPEPLRISFPTASGESGEPFRVYSDGTLYSDNRTETLWTPDRLEFLRLAGPALVKEWKDKLKLLGDQELGFELELEHLRHAAALLDDQVAVS